MLERILSFLEFVHPQIILCQTSVGLVKPCQVHHIGIVHGAVLLVNYGLLGRSDCSNRS